MYKTIKYKTKQIIEMLTYNSTDREHTLELLKLLSQVIAVKSLSYLEVSMLVTKYNKNLNSDIIVEFLLDNEYGDYFLNRSHSLLPYVEKINNEVKKWYISIL